MNITKEKFLNDSELDQLISTLDRHKGSRDSILIRLTLYTGARSCEVLGVKKADLGDQSVTIHGRKNSNDRSIPLPEQFYNELLEFAGAVDDNDLIFPISSRHFRRIWDQYRPNNKKGLHSLRHTVGKEAYKNTRNIHLVKTLLGHKSINNTMIYLDFVEGQEQMKESMQGIWKKSS